MLDRLLGRAELRARIDELEADLETCRDELQTLEDRYEAEQRRRKEAVRDRQEAQEELNRTEDRVAQLEGRVAELSDDERSIEFRGTASFRGDRIATVLDRLAGFDAAPEGALTAVVEDEVPDAVREAFGDHSALVARAAPCIALTDDEGLVSVALRPPVRPEPHATWADRFELDRSWFLPTGEFALGLVRADLFALGEYRGEERLSVRGFESDVDADHSKGGFSQARFERRRDEQIDEHLKQCEAALRDRTTDRLLLAGERGALDVLDVEADATIPVDATGDPEAALDDAFRDVWTTRLYRI